MENNSVSLEPYWQPMSFLISQPVKEPFLVPQYIPRASLGGDVVHPGSHALRGNPKPPEGTSSHPFRVPDTSAQPSL